MSTYYWETALFGLILLDDHLLVNPQKISHMYTIDDEHGYKTFISFENGKSARTESTIKEIQKRLQKHSQKHPYR